ncbi:cupin [Saccharopolyspora subtropica]|uniref:Cupin n=1 Tax=Saccharopolyspora thermophila TaxID=89367 RepID=A0A917K659_9PSEU|nr:cupin domain-containing protein [Saccharopolyspora subtropica]GGJ02430.1 cupin [Saccharopolyspora subtropica]
MALEKKSLDQPDDTRDFSHGKVDVVELPGVTVGRGTMRPGWKWSNDVKPIVGTNSCEQAHTMYVLQGRLHVVMDDGAEAEIGAGEAAVVSPGHDAWVVGDEDFVALDWSGAATYAAPEE